MNFPELRDSTFSSHFSSNFLHTGNYFLVSPTQELCVQKANSAVANIPPRNSSLEHLTWGIRKLWNLCSRDLKLSGVTGLLGGKKLFLCYEFFSQDYLLSVLSCFFFMDGAFLPWFLVLCVNHSVVGFKTSLMHFCCAQAVFSFSFCIKTEHSVLRWQESIKQGLNKFKYQYLSFLLPQGKNKTNKQTCYYDIDLTWKFILCFAFLQVQDGTFLLAPAALS